MNELYPVVSIQQSWVVRPDLNGGDVYSSTTFYILRDYPEGINKFLMDSVYIGRYDSARVEYCDELPSEAPASTDKTRYEFNHFDVPHEDATRWEWRDDEDGGGWYYNH